ncbi:MAG: hypothetical protein KBA03_01770 [Anaerolineaceae bacterium]|nr:hypothetical protein [Anaerolineaceae bacterium]
MKKTSMLLLCLVYIATVLYGCGSSEAELAAQAATAEAQAAAIKDQKAFDTAKEAYTALSNAADSTISVMDSIYNAWYFGIYDADDSSPETVISDLAKEVPLSREELDAGLQSLAKELDDDESGLLRLMASDSRNVSNWQWLLYLINESYNVNGKFDEIQENIDLANVALKTMTAEFDDYKHYPALKELYSKVVSYAEFAQSPTGSFQQLSGTITDYENDIRTLRSDLSFVFD